MADGNSNFAKINMEAEYKFLLYRLQKCLPYTLWSLEHNLKWITSQYIKHSIPAFITTMINKLTVYFCWIFLPHVMMWKGGGWEHKDKKKKEPKRWRKQVNIWTSSKTELWEGQGRCNSPRHLYCIALSFEFKNRPLQVHCSHGLYFFLDVSFLRDRS